ncbi:hypothetical protein SORBI_3003G132050 [Sorghum bicolor]|uniref:Uncharacterized protein n=1 Tax=Sorghum bicolor TaxID=4558 RepID=A0A1W0VX41_SORBI|nr:hypothetical protein SORBI_3003G132050 [Sorghum bicolor]
MKAASAAPSLLPLAFLAFATRGHFFALWLHIYNNCFFIELGFMLIQLGHCAAVGAQDMHHLRRDIRFRSPPNKLDQRSFFVTLIYPPL